MGTTWVRRDGVQPGVSKDNPTHWPGWAAPFVSMWLGAVESREDGPHPGKTLTLFLLDFIQMLPSKA